MAESAVSATRRNESSLEGRVAFRDIVYPLPGQCTRLSGLSNN